MTLPGVAEHPKRSQDRLFKWVAAVGAACLIGFVVFVITRVVLASGERRLCSPGVGATAGPPCRHSGPGLLAPAAAGDQSCRAVGLPGQAGDRQLLRLVVPRLPGRTPRDGSYCPGDHGSPDVVGVDSNETSTAKARQLLAAAGATYPVASDAEAKVASQYLVQALPVTYFLNGSGQVVGAALGPQRVSSLEHWVSRLGAAG